MRVRSVLVAAALTLLLVSCGGGEGGTRYEGPDLAPGEPVSASSLRGEAALPGSRATWCRECDEELAGLQEFADSDAAQGIPIVAVTLDAADAADEIDAKVAKHGLSVDLWRDRRNEFKRTFGALGVPTTVLLNADGEVVGTFPGAIDFDDADVLAAIDDVRS